MKVGPGGSGKYTLMAEINMIPLIDVALVLLIIFMVMTPFLVSSQLKINLPKASTGQAPDADPVKIQITKSGLMYVGGQSIHSNDLAGVLRSRFMGEKNPVVLIEADASVPFESVVQVMDTAKAQGAQKLGVAVGPSQEPKKSR